MNKKEQHRLLDLYLKGKINKNEVSSFLNFLKTKDGENLLERSINYNDFKEKHIHIDINAKDQTEMFKQIESKINRRKCRNIQFMKIAATILLVCTLSITSYLYISHKQSEYVEIKTTDKPKDLILPDGSFIKLNKNSQLSYLRSFDKEEERKIKFHGEAFFKIAKNPKRPFIIDVNNAFIRVVGTQFNVKSALRSSRVMVAVQEGCVKFCNKENKEEVTLLADDVGILNERNNLAKVDQPSDNYFSWFQSYLEFNNTPLITVIEQLENIYDVKIKLKNEELANKSFTAYMRKTSIEKVLNQLAYSMELKLNKQNNVYLLSK